jgi:carnitine O-acetyltransferase
MYGKNRPTYESAATRKYQQGRTETTRTVSDESVAFCDSMADPSVSREDCERVFRAAVQAHVKYTADASDGYGVDRHLFGLKKLLQEGEETPEIFKDPAFAYSSTWYISSSQLSSEYFNGYGWSQVVDQGWGIAYMINENRYVFFPTPLRRPCYGHTLLVGVDKILTNSCACSIQFNIVSKKLGCERMSFYLGEAASDIRDMLLPSLEPAKAKL